MLYEVGNLAVYKPPAFGPPPHPVHEGKVGRIVEVVADANYPEAMVTVRYRDGTPELITFASRIRAPSVTEEIETLLLGSGA